LNGSTYDALWQGVWGDMQRVGPVHRHIRESMVRLVGKLGVHTIVDVGCGAGDTLAALAAAGTYDVTGIDISREALALAATRIPSAHFARLDIEVESLPQQFDLVLSVQVIEHLRDDVTALKHVARMARRWVLISTMRGRMRRSERSIGHLRNYKRGELESKLAEAGLRAVRVDGWGFPFYSPLYRSLVEWLPGGPPAGPVGRTGQLAAASLYQLYRLNWPGRGDVVSILAEPS
jgi:SAM-dependent methyltransferase